MRDDVTHKLKDSECSYLEHKGSAKIYKNRNKKTHQGIHLNVIHTMIHLNK